MLAARGGGVGDRRRLGNADTEHTPRGAGVPGSDTDENPHCPRPHQMQGGGVRGAAPHEHGEVEPGDELLEVQRLRLRGDMLRRDHGPLDHEDVEPGIQHDGGEPFHPLRRERAARDDAARFDLLDPSAEQLLLHRLLVELLHPTGRLVVVELGDLLVDRHRILVPGPDALEVETGEPAELPDQDGGLRGHPGIHRGRHHRERETVGIDLPADVHVVGVACPPRGDDRHLVEAVGPPGRLPDPDLVLHPDHPRRCRTERETPIREPGWASDRCMGSAYQPTPTQPFRRA